jgi:hypothetical protein
MAHFFIWERALLYISETMRARRGRKRRERERERAGKGAEEGGLFFQTSPL